MSLLSRKAAVITAIACGSLIVIAGITALILGVKGYFTFEDPCIGVESFKIKNLNLGQADGGSANIVMGFLDAFTGGRASDLVPTQATMTIEMILEVNNTNPYDLDYEQKDEGLIEIPADEEGTAEDLVIGTWEVPSSTLKSNARNEIPVEVTTTIDLLSADTMNLAGSFVSGQAMVFRVKGGIQGSSWVPGATGMTTFLCLANVDNILDLDSGANVRCKHETRVGKIINEKGELEFLSADVFDDDEVDPACYV